MVFGSSSFYMSVIESRILTLSLSQSSCSDTFSHAVDPLRRTRFQQLCVSLMILSQT